jgi:hypothetical protein
MSAARKTWVMHDGGRSCLTKATYVEHHHKLVIWQGILGRLSSNQLTAISVY